MFVTVITSAPGISPTDGTVVVGSMDYHWYRFSASTGTVMGVSEVYTFGLSGQITMTRSGMAVCADNHGNFQYVSSATANWYYISPSNNAFYSSVAFGSDGSGAFLFIPMFVTNNGHYR